MRQVPPKPFFALVGQGRVGRALAAYLSARQLPYRVITRSSLISQITPDQAPFSAALLAVSDSSIAEVAREFREIAGFKVPLVHFSGSVQVEGVHGFHPLFSFTTRELEPTEFEKIPFLLDPGEANLFREIFADFKNPFFELSHKRDARYHALCVLLGNLPLVIQDTCARHLEGEFGVPRDACAPFLASLLKNFETAMASNPKSLVAGPIARRDQSMTQLHLDALRGDAFLNDLYALFVKHSWPEFPAPRRSDEKHP